MSDPNRVGEDLSNWSPRQPERIADLKRSRERRPGRFAPWERDIAFLIGFYEAALEAPAARRFLALTETGREIRWCEEHDQAVPGGDNPEPRCWFSWHYGSPDRTNIYEKPCRIVSKFLADYLTEEET